MMKSYTIEQIVNDSMGGEVSDKYVPAAVAQRLYQALDLLSNAVCEIDGLEDDQLLKLSYRVELAGHALAAADGEE